MANDTQKVGILSCAGEDIPEGTISRLAVRKVMEELRPGRVLTLCLPLFLAGDGGEREFAQTYPTITIDGCDKQCAKWGTETHSGPVSASLIVTDILKAAGITPSGARSGRRLTEADMAAVDAVAQEVAHALDQMAGGSGEVAEGTSTACGCAVPLPTGTIEINGESVKISGLPLIFAQCRDNGLLPDSPDVSQRLLEVVTIYYPIDEQHASAYATALRDAYTAFLQAG